MSVLENSFKTRLKAGESLLGIWNSLASPVASEALSLLGYDWMLFDTEHSPVEISMVQPLLQAAAGGTAAHVARPAWNDKVLVKRLLDIGVQTLLIPFVQNAEEARNAVAATRYPPAGIRGVAGSTRASRYGTTKDYLGKANEQICVLAQIETGDALEHLEDIASVEGIDGIFIGPSDLSASLGYLGNPSAEKVQEVIQNAAKRILACNKAPGILATNVEDGLRYREWGYQFIACGVDISLLVSTAQARLQKFGKAGDRTPS